MHRMFGASGRVDYCEPRDRFSVDFTAVALGDMTLAQADIVNGEISREIGNSVHITLPVGGRLKCRSGPRQSEAVSGQSAPVGLPLERVTARSVSGAGLALTVPLPVLIARAERLAGEPLGGSIESIIPVNVDLADAAGAALMRNMGAAFEEMTRLHAIGLSELALDGFADVVLNLAVVTLFPKIAEPLGRAPAKASPAVIRRARDYIAAHAFAPIELSKLASDLGLSMRTLQDNFQRHYGLSPRDYVMDCRLELAHRRLRMPETGDSVTRIAVESGFTDLGHFSARYRRRYGELPSETLRSARS